MGRCDAGNFFHLLQHGREVLFLIVCELIVVDAKRCDRCRHDDMLLCGRFQNQPKILVHQTKWKLRAVIVNSDSGQLSHMGGGDHSCL